MFNTSESIIPFDVIENGSVIYSGQIPYDLLDYIINELLRNTERTLQFTVDSRQYSFNMKYWNETVDEVVEPNTLMIEQNALKDQKQWYQDQQVALASENALQDILQNSMVREETNREKILADLAAAGELQFQEMLMQANLLEEERISNLYAEQERVDMLRARTVIQVATDPTTAVDALQSEVGNTGDVQRQIAAVMRANKEISKLVVNSPQNLWTTSYEIMDVLAVQAFAHPDLAELLKSKLPEDSLLLLALNTLIN